MSCYYAGIGSRETPASVQAFFFMLAGELGDLGWTLRSGGADGADAAFEQGLAATHTKEIFLPWRKFNGNVSGLYVPSAEAFALAEKFHPAWNRCSPAARKLLARNMHQVLGADLSTPVQFIVCWTPEGQGSGGTGQALRLAQDRGIPVFDFGLGPHMRDALDAWLEEHDDRPKARRG
jgi:hypothetical protein